MAGAESGGTAMEALDDLGRTGLLAKPNGKALFNTVALTCCNTHSVRIRAFVRRTVCSIITGPIDLPLDHFFLELHAVVSCVGNRCKFPFFVYCIKLVNNDLGPRFVSVWHFLFWRGGNNYFWLLWLLLRLLLHPVPRIALRDRRRIHRECVDHYSPSSRSLAFAVSPEAREEPHHQI